MNTFNSWLKLPRSFVNWQWYENTNMLHTYLYLLLNANLEDTTKNGVTVRRGENIATLKQMEEETGLSVQNIRTCLSKLFQTHEIKFKKMKNLRVIVMVNFNSYQPIGIDEVNPDWVKLYRCLLEWNWYKIPSMVHLMVHFMLQGKPIVQSDGKRLWQLITSYRRLSKETGLSIRSIRTCLSKLDKAGEIAVSFLPTQQISIITLCNYDSYDQNFNPINTKIARLQQENRQIELCSKKRLPTHPKQAVSTCNTDTYITLEASNQHKDNTEIARLYEGNTTKTQHEGNASVTPLIRYKEAKDNISSSPSRARARHFDFVEISQEGEVGKENEQKKARKENFYDLLKGNESWLMAIAKKFHLESSRQVVSKLEDFQLDLMCRGRDEHKSLQDCMEHFNDWLEISLKKGKKETAPRSPYAPNSPFAQKERWVGEYYVPKSSEGGIYEGKI